MNKAQIYFYNFESYLEIDELQKYYNESSCESFYLQSLEKLNNKSFSDKACVLLVHLKNKSDLQNLVQLLKLNRVLLENKTLRIATVLTKNNPKIEKVLNRFGGKDFILFDLKVRSLIYKIDFWARGVERSYLKFQMASSEDIALKASHNTAPKSEQVVEGTEKILTKMKGKGSTENISNGHLSGDLKNSEDDLGGFYDGELKEKEIKNSDFLRSNNKQSKILEDKNSKKGKPQVEREIGPENSKKALATKGSFKGSLKDQSSGLKGSLFDQKSTQSGESNLLSFASKEKEQKKKSINEDIDKMMESSSTGVKIQDNETKEVFFCLLENLEDNELSVKSSEVLIVKKIYTATLSFDYRGETITITADAEVLKQDESYYTLRLDESSLPELKQFMTLYQERQDQIINFMLLAKGM